MNNLALVQSENFGAVRLDFYRDSQNEIWVTREQIGSGLEYSQPREAIKKIHQRHKARLDQFSRGAQIDTPLGGRQKTTVYNAKGIYEICRWSEQPKADAFYDWIYELLEALRKGEVKVVSMTEYQASMIRTREENVRIRKARELLKLAAGYEGKPYKQALESEATAILTGQRLIPLPVLEERTFSAEEIGSVIGCSSNKVGRLANAAGLKTEDYGRICVDKARHSNKEVETFRYYERAIPMFRKLLEEK